MQMKDTDWIVAGYKRFDVKRPEVHKLADYLLQKRFDDEDGKRYFITVYCYDKTRYPPPHNVGVGYMPTAHFSLGDDKPFFNIEMNGIDGWNPDVAAIEAWFDAFWKLCGRPYYEKWETHD